MEVVRKPRSSTIIWISIIQIIVIVRNWANLYRVHRRAQHARAKSEAFLAGEHDVPRAEDERHARRQTFCGGRARRSGVLGKLPQGRGEAFACPCDSFRLGVLFVVRDALRHYVVAGACNAPSPSVLIVKRIETQHVGVEGMAGRALSPFR